MAVLYSQQQIFQSLYDLTNNAIPVEIVGLTSNTSVQRVSAGFMAPGQTAKQYTGKNATSTTLATTITLETVTAGKTYYMTDISIFTDSTTSIDGSINAGGTPIYRFGTSTTAPLQMAGMETQPYGSSGQTVVLVLPPTTSVQNVWFNVAGFEQ